MIITINGKPGSGKSTVAKKLAETFAFKHYYIGGMRRQAARERGLTLAEFNKLGETDESTDKEFDEYIAKVGREQDDFVVEGRTAWHFIPQSLKIFINVSEAEGARRIWGALRDKSQADRNEDKDLKSYEDVLASTCARIQSDTLRYKKYYNLEIFDKRNYDLWLEATDLDPDEEFQAVLKFVQSKISSRTFNYKNRG